MENISGGYKGNNYVVSDDGIIYKIEDDGSINRIAQINSDGQIVNVSGTTTDSKGIGKGIYWFIIILLIVTSLFLGLLYGASEDKNYVLSSNLSEQNTTILGLRESLNYSQSELQDVQNELKNLQNIVSGTYPLIITDIKIGNVYNDGTIETDYGNTIYSENTMYLNPKIEYVGLYSCDVKLMIKFFYSDGQLSQGDSSPSGFSASDTIHIYAGFNRATLIGWGNSNKGHWGSGTYRIEIWYGNACLKSQQFTIY